MKSRIACYVRHGSRQICGGPRVSVTVHALEPLHAQEGRANAVATRKVLLAKKLNNAHLDEADASEAKVERRGSEGL